MPTFEEKLQAVDTLTHMGLEALEDTVNCLHVKMPIKGNGNHFGAVYAGAICTLAEFPFGMLFANRFSLKELYPVVGEMSVRFVTPAFGDLFVKVEVSDEQWQAIKEETLANGKMKIERETEITDEAGNVCAIAKATYFAVKSPE